MIGSSSTATCWFKRRVPTAWFFMVIVLAPAFFAARPCWLALAPAGLVVFGATLAHLRRRIADEISDTGEGRVRARSAYADIAQPGTTP